MKFYDCNVYFGLPSLRPIVPVATPSELLAAMDRAGVDQALVWHIAQHDHSPQLGNQLLTEAIAPHPRLTGCWTILPNQGHEFPQPKALFAQMKAARIKALRVFPGKHRFLLNAVSMGDILDAMVQQRVPLFLSINRGMEWRNVYELLAGFPQPGLRGL